MASNIILNSTISTLFNLFEMSPFGVLVRYIFIRRPIALTIILALGHFSPSSPIRLCGCLLSHSHFFPILYHGRCRNGSHVPSAPAATDITHMAGHVTKLIPESTGEPPKPIKIIHERIPTEHVFTESHSPAPEKIHLSEIIVSSLLSPYLSTESLLFLWLGPPAAKEWVIMPENILIISKGLFENILCPFKSEIIEPVSAPEALKPSGTTSHASEASENVKIKIMKVVAWHLRAPTVGG